MADQSVRLVLPSTLQGKIYVSLGANSFLLEKISFKKGLVGRKNKEDVTEVDSGRKLPSVSPSILGKMSADDILKYSSYFPQKTGFDIGEMSKHVFWVKNKIEKYHQFVVY